MSLDDIGGAFDFSNLSTLGIGQFEVYRGPNSVLYGSDASAGVVSLSTPRGSTAFPSFFYEGDAGTFTSFRNLAQLGGTQKRLDYYGGFDAFQSDNSLKMDEFHDDTATANLGYALTAATQLRVVARNSDAAVGTPGAFNFYGIADAGKRADQDTYLAASADNRTFGGWHNLVRYGMTRKREEDINFYAAGIQLPSPRSHHDELLRLQYPHPRSQRRLGDRAGALELRWCLPQHGGAGQQSRPDLFAERLPFYAASPWYVYLPL